MKRWIMCCLLFFASVAHAGERRFIGIEDLLDPAKQEENEIILNQMFADIWASKANKPNATLSEPRFYVHDLLDPKYADENAFALNENADDLWREKDGQTGERRFRVYDLLNPELAEYNTLAINGNFEDLEVGKTDQ